MNYELAKELKDAGFPQGMGDYLYAPDVKEWGANDMAQSPTLSELIEACGPDNEFTLWKQPSGWQAINGHYGDDATAEGSGSTPEEAVAWLWLALNKKP